MDLASATFRPTQRGFTLIELMITVVVVAILAAVALPSFMDQVRKARRADAVASLTQIQQAQERWRSNNSTFTTTLGSGGLGLGAATSGNYYALTIASPATDGTATAVTGATTSNSYSVIATAPTTSAQNADTGCQVMKLNMFGGNVTYWAGAAANAMTEASANANAKRCWNR